jgi:hypothetical protein
MAISANAIAGAAESAWSGFPGNTGGAAGGGGAGAYVPGGSCDDCCTVPPTGCGCTQPPPFCRNGVFLYTGSGFTGACSVFNLTAARLVYAGTVGPGSCIWKYRNFATGVQMTLYQSSLAVGIYLELKLEHPIGSVLATYDGPANTFDCTATGGNTLSRTSTTCPASPATVAIITNTPEQPWACDCAPAEIVLPPSLHLTISASTNAHYPNGTYTVIWKDSSALPAGDGYYVTLATNYQVIFSPMGDSSCAASGGALGVYLYTPAASFDGSGNSNGTCTCAPYSVPGTANPTSGGSFSWSASE